MTIAMLLTIFTTSTLSSMSFMLCMMLALPIARLSMKNEVVDAESTSALTPIYTPNGFYLTSR
jgi:hypothetical protein